MFHNYSYLTQAQQETLDFSCFLTLKKMQKTNVKFLSLYLLVIGENVSEECIQSVTLSEHLQMVRRDYSHAERNKRASGNASVSLVDDCQVGDIRST